MFIRKSFKILIPVIVILSFSITSCEWKEYDPDTVGIENVSFSQDIIPIFNQSCNAVGCHSENGVPPDLTPENAYQDLINTNMIDVANPERSELYIRMTDVTNPMPLSGILSPRKTTTVLVWIQEGAQDN